MLQVHGFPKVMCVLTHLDKFDNTKTLRATKKKLKTRFWTEVYNGAKVFGMGGEINGKYPKNEVRRRVFFLFHFILQFYDSDDIRYSMIVEELAEKCPIPLS